MGILSFIDTTFILTLGIVLLICGGIMIYCYRRLNALENGLIQQGRVLQEFISNYNNSQLTAQKKLEESYENYEVKNPVNLSVNSVDENKIVVSDEDDSDEDTDNESDDDVHDDNDDDDNDDNNSDDSTSTKSNDNINITDLDNEDVDLVCEEPLDNSNLGNIGLVDDISINNFNIDEISDKIESNIKELILEDLTDNNNLLDLGVLDISSSNSKKIIPISDTDGQDITKKNPNKLKVDELRELVVNKNLISNEDAQKLKKNELLKLLE